MMLNRESSDLVFLFIILLIPGIFFGNLVIVSISLVPLFLLIIGLAFSPPRVVVVETDEIATPAWVGANGLVVRRVRTSDGIGLIKLYQPLPQEFALAEDSNLAWHWQWFRGSTVEMSFRIRFTKRGNYSIPPLEWVSQHPLKLVGGQGSDGAQVTLNIWPRFYLPRSLKTLPGLSVSPLPSADIAKIGIPGQDFREIRAYVSGDPIKNINWRAMARRAEQYVWPLVNEYEREGRKSVLIYLDANPAIEIGDNIENGLECSLEAAVNLLFYFLEKGYRTGIYICGHISRYLHPDTSRIQFRKALRYLMDVRPAYQINQLLTAVETTRDYVLGYNPLTIVITTLDMKTNRVVETAVSRLRQMYNRHRRPAIMVISIDAYGLIPQDMNNQSHITELTRLQMRPFVRRLRSYGANVIEWHPDRETFSSVISRKVMVR